MNIIRSAIGSLASVALLKFFKENGFYIVGTDITQNCVGKFFVDSFYIVPKAEIENEESLINKYLDISIKNNIKYIISGPEEEILILSKHKKTFERIGVYLFHPDLETLLVIMDKYKMFSRLKRKFKIPKTFLLEELKFQGKYNTYSKFVLKPRKGRGSKGVQILTSLDDLPNISNPEDFIIQEYINGEEFTVDVLCDLQGKILNIVPRKRVLVDSGISVISKTEMNNELIEIVLNILKEIPMKGMVCLQFIKSFKDKHFYLIDINPRFGGGSILSIQSSKTLQKNLLNLLNGYIDNLIYESTDFKEITMYRYYKEVYVEE